MTLYLNLTLTELTARINDAQTGEILGEIKAGHKSVRELFFTRIPLDALALERAIEWIEDRIQEARLTLPEGSQLSTSDPDIQVLKQLANIEESGAALHVDAVEQMFSRLVLQAFGQSPTTQNVSDSTRVFATVVLMREILHHLRFERIYIKQAAKS